jgi:hypothetical protein
LRSIERSLRHAGNVEEMARGDTPRLLAHLLRYIMSLPLPSSSAIDAADGSLVVGRSGRGDEELVLSVIGLATATKVRVSRLPKRTDIVQLLTTCLCIVCNWYCGRVFLSGWCDGKLVVLMLDLPEVRVSEL